MRLVTLVVGVLVLTAAGTASWPTFRNEGISIRHPPSWSATRRQLTPVDWPRQVFAVASYSLPEDPRPNGCMPAGTLADMPRRGALIFGIEYTHEPTTSFPAGGFRSRDFPPRPTHFRLGSARRHECLGGRRSYLVRFREARRLFQVQVAFGREAGVETRKTVLRVLDSLRAKPR